MNNNQQFNEWKSDANKQNNRHIIKSHRQHVGFKVSLSLLVSVFLIFGLLINLVEPVYVWAQEIPGLNFLAQSLKVNLGDEINLEQAYVQDLNIQQDNVRVKAASIDSHNVIVFIETTEENPQYHLKINNLSTTSGIGLPPIKLQEENLYMVSVDFSQHQTIETLELVGVNVSIDIPIDSTKVLPIKTIEINEEIKIEDASVVISRLDVGAYTSRLILEYNDADEYILGAPRIKDQQGELIGTFMDVDLSNAMESITPFELNLLFSQSNSIRINKGQLNWDGPIVLNFEAFDKIDTSGTWHTFDSEELSFSYIPEAFTITNIEKPSDYTIEFVVENENDHIWFWSPFIWEENINEDALSCEQQSCTIGLLRMGSDIDREIQYQVNRGEVIEVNKEIKVDLDK